MASCSPARTRSRVPGASWPRSSASPASPMPLGEADYADEHTTYRAFRYVTTWDGPITPQPVGGRVRRVAEHRAAARADRRSRDRVHARLGGPLRRLAARAGGRDRAPPSQGWDSVATVVEGRWLDRVPEYPDAAAQLTYETRLMPRLAPLLPLEVPVPILLEEEPLRVRHRLVVGAAAPRTGPSPPTTDAGWASSSAPCTTCRSTSTSSPGIPDRVAARSELLATLERMLHRVLPLTPEELQEPGSELLRRVALKTPTTLIHGDLGPHHVLVRDDRVVGVIDWSDARIGDPAVDLGVGALRDTRAVRGGRRDGVRRRGRRAVARAGLVPPRPVVRRAVGPGGRWAGVRRVRARRASRTVSPPEAGREVSAGRRAATRRRTRRPGRGHAPRAWRGSGPRAS